MRHWLTRMEDCHKHDEWHTRAPDNVKNIHKCVLLLDRIISDEYEFSMPLEEYKLLNNNQRKLHWKQCQNMQKQDFDLLFKIIKNKSGMWWV